jgi:ERCC4-type nuclease
VIFVAPTEPPELRAIADKVSILPENYGVDVFFFANSRKVGVQRKEYKDLIASTNDGRIVKEVLQMEALDYKILLVEGDMKWTDDGNLILPFATDTWNRNRWDGLLWSIQDRGVWVMYTDGLTGPFGTIGLIPRLESWFSKTSHSSLATRPGTAKPLWGGVASDRDYAVWFMQGVPGIGAELAGRIYDKLGLVFGLEVGIDELMTVEGIGKGKAEKICKMFTSDKDEG